MNPNYLKAGYGTRQTPQTEPIPGRTDQVENSASGYAWAIDDWSRLRRFLILGSEGGSYYASERKLTTENLTAVHACIAQDGPRVVAELEAISVGGRAPKQQPALYVLAMACSASDDATRKAALAAIPNVCRTASTLFTFCGFVEQFRGWGRGLRRAIGEWYQQPADKLAYQAVKYRQRDGWTHRDLLRLAHPVTKDGELEDVWKFCLTGDETSTQDMITGFLLAQKAASPTATADFIREYKLPREAVNPEHLTDPEVWQALLDVGMPMTALIRNLGNLSKCGLLTPMSAASRTVVEQLADGERIRKARVHPIQILAAMLTYGQGHGSRGSGEWTPVPQVVDALDAAFYTAFGNVEPANKATMLALDVSGSMAGGYGSGTMGIPGLTPRVGAAAMALITAATEPEYACCIFSTTFQAFNLSPRQRLDDVVRATSNLPFGGTDCALPMRAASAWGAKVDTFVVYTDSETYAGTPHPSQALAQYREQTGIDARLIVVGMVSNGFTIADPRDRGMLDVVGFDTATPQVISQFSAGSI